MQYNCQKSSNFQGLSHFSRIFGKNDKIPGFFQAGKTVTIFPGFPGAVGTLLVEQVFSAVVNVYSYVPKDVPLSLQLNFLTCSCEETWPKYLTCTFTKAFF